MNFKRLRLLRVSARVIRCHTTPTLHMQSVGEHTFGCLNILYTIDHAPSAQLVRALLWHDAPEAIGGDVPAPAKRLSAKLKEGITEMEAAIIKEYDLIGEDQLTPLERDKLFYCDLMDLAIFSLEEAEMGNRPAIVLCRRALGAILKRGVERVTPAADELYQRIYTACHTRFNHEKVETAINQWYDYDEK